MNSIPAGLVVHALMNTLFRFAVNYVFRNMGYPHGTLEVC
jgi:hypothetical protein